MSSSWFNISGNLSSIASNVSNFTKEVLHDAAKNNSENDNPQQPEYQYEPNPPNVAAAAYQSPDHLGEIAHLQNELQTLRNDNAYKNEQIYHLQTQGEETINQYNSHFENLKQNLLEKEKEIEVFSQRYNEVSAKNYELESKLTEKDTFNYNMDADWTDDWGGNNGGTQDIDDLKFKNECLANDLAMKEIILNAVESKMCEISNSSVEVSNFSEWLDGILQEKVVPEDNKQILDDKTNVENQWKETCLMIDKHMDGHIGSCDKNYLENVDEWISNIISNNNTSERDNEEYKDIISNIEVSISKHSDGYDDFKISNFSEWLDSLGNDDMNYIFYNDSSKTMLDKIQNEIRDFDDDDGDFQIEDFSAWLEKVQCRIDDLEVEVINEQETRDAEEKQRILERETLNDLFIQKQKEISLLKVELYNKSSHTLNPIVEFEQEDLMTVQEQLNETTARCEALQHELSTAQKQITESGTQEHLATVGADYEHIKEQLSKAELDLTQFKEEYDSLSGEFCKLSEESKDWESKYDLLQSEETSAAELKQQLDDADTSTAELKQQLDDMAANNTSLTEEIQNFQLSKENIQTELDEFKIKYDSVCAEHDRDSKEHAEQLSSVREALQHAETGSQDLQVQVVNLSAINDCIKEQLLTSESSKESIQAELSEMKIRYDSMSTQIERVTSELKEATNRYELLQAAETVSDSLQLQLDNLCADKDNLKEQLLISESSKESVQSELNEWKMKYNSISAEFEELSSALNKTKAECDVLQSKEGALEALQTQFSEQSSQLDIHKEQLVTLQSMKESMQIELEELKTEYQRLSGEHDLISKDHNDITSKYEATKLREHEMEEATSDYEKLKEINSGISEELKRVNNELVEGNKVSKNVENELQDIKTEYNLLKLVQLQSEEDKEKLQYNYTALKETNEANEKTDVSKTDADLTLMADLLTNMINETLQPSDLDVSISSEKSVMLFGCIKGLAGKFTALCKQCNDLNCAVDEYKSKLLEQESKMGDHENVYNILTYIINSIDNILPEDRRGNVIVNGALCSTDLSTYVSYVQSLEEFIRNIDEIKENYIKLNNGRHEEVEKMENLLQTEKVVKEEYISKVDVLNVTVEGYKDTVENLKLQIKEAAELQKAGQTVSDSGGSGGDGGGGRGGKGGDSGGLKFGAIKRKLLDLEAKNKFLTEENEVLKKGDISAGSSNLTDEMKGLQREVSDKNQEVECYKEECQLLKSSVLEMQQQIIVADSAHAECKLLKEKLLEYENMIETASNVSDEAFVATRHHQDQLHSLSLMLTEKNEEIEKYQEETINLKSKLLEVENEISDLELIREECKQLKAMLVGKEHQNRIDDTITMLQQESKQLKQILCEKDTELQHMHNITLEKENELSNMELIREECKQLKQMLVTEHPTPSLSNENAELKAKNAEIVALRSSNSDMELLREECRQLKQMLLNSSSHNISEPTSEDTSENISYQLLEAMLEDRDIQIHQKDTVILELQSKVVEMNLLQDECKQLKDILVGKERQEANNITDPTLQVGPANSTAELVESSFVEQVQQLEEFLKEKDEELRNKERELEVLTAKLNEKEIIISDFDTIEREYEMLKAYLTEKEQVLIELQNDLDNANDALQQKNTDVKIKENSCVELEKGIKEARNIINVKDSEIRRLNEEVSESMAQDETLHILQTEYRNVEERLRETENDLERSESQLYKVKEILNETENECERMKLYAEQNSQLSISLKQRDEELSLLKLQSTEDSIMESDIVSRLHEQLNELNTLLYESEQKNDEFSKRLEQKNIELENVNYNCNHLKNDIVALNNEHVEKSKIEKENLQSEKETLLQLCFDKEEYIKSLLDNAARLETEIGKHVSETNTLKSRISVFEKTLKENASVINEKVNQTNRLLQQVKQKEVEKGNLEVNMLTQEEKLYQLQTSLDYSIREINTKTVKISQLESELTTSKENQEQLSESIKVDSLKPKQCTNCNYLDTERKMIITILESIAKILDLSEHQHDPQDDTYSIIQHLSTIEICLKNLLINIRKKVENCRENEKSNYNPNITENDTLLSVWNTLVTTLDKKAEENISMFSEQGHTFSLKIQDLQSQLVENNEIQTLYQTKCLEYDNLQEQFLQFQNENKEQKQNREVASNSRMQEELEVLRTELERNSHLYLNKNKEVDTLKLELLQLEENVYEYKLEIGTLKAYEEAAKLNPSLVMSIRNKDQEINRLKSILEDKELILESNKKDKQFLDELLKEKEHLEKEKEELLYQKEQNDRLVHEKEILLRHKDVKLKELEAKSNRELERLRNHMMMTEDSHTKDILELQDKEEALQQDLEGVKQGLSKKSIILQDSSKQFQDHCIDLEEQLHHLSSQRDSLLLDFSKAQDKIAEDSMAIYNLQNALEQIQKEKFEQSDYLTSFAKRKEIEYEGRIEELTEELNKTQGAMSEASLAVQGINKLNLELQQKENELKVSKEKANDLVTRLHHMELERDKILEAVDQKLDKSLLRNLLMKYFQSPDDKRADILHVIGGLLGWSAVEIQEIGSGAAPSKLGGWITNVWGYGSPRKTPSGSRKATPVGTPTYDTNKSFSELFVNFLENETTSHKPVDTTSLTLNNDISPNIHMFVSPTTPDILASHNNSQDQRIPAPGQEIARVHTNHAQSTLKSILTTTPY